MRPNRKIFMTLTMLVLASLACQLGSALATPTSPPTATDLPSPTLTLTSTATPTATNTPRPTRTPLPPSPTAGPNTYINADQGVNIRYPNGWRATRGEGGYDVWFVRQNISCGLWIQHASSDDTPESVTTTVVDEFVSALTNTKILASSETRIGNDQSAWTAILTGTDKVNGTQFKINITTAIKGSQAFILITFAPPEEYARREQELQALISSMVLTSPTLYGGISRESALIYESSETSNLAEYDPATTHGSGDKLVFTGLVSFDPQLQLVPELAATWELSADGTVYTFHLRPEARFHDGRPVVAQDVIYSWERAADPKTNSDTVLTYLGDIVGVKALNAGEADHIRGLAALDDHTLQVTIDAPKPYFLMKLTYPTAFVVDRANVEQGETWVRQPNGTGPYKLTRWDKNEVIIYESNPDYYLGEPAIPYIIYRLFAGVGLSLYETGDVDITGVYSSDVPRVLDPTDPLSKDLVRGVDMCTSYIIFDVTQPPFDDVKVRQAFTMAFDRQRYIEVLLDNFDLPAEGLYPPGLPGYNADLKGLPFDPERARQLLQESKYGGAQNLPSITFTTGGYGSDIGPSLALLAQMWKKHLGVEINIENLDPEYYNDEVRAGHHGQLLQQGWCADYPDPENFADVLFHTGAEFNDGNYSNPQLDALLEQARTERDVAKRITMYQQAEQIIVAEAPVIFTSYSLSFMLVKPYVKGYTFTPIAIPIEKYLTLDWSK